MATCSTVGVEPAATRSLGGPDQRGAGSLLLFDASVGVAPRGVPHAFLVVSATARLLCLHTPGCCQAFYWDASEPITVDNPASRTVDFTLVQASAKSNGGIDILGPPPFNREG